MSDFGTMIERVANEIARPEIVSRIPDEIRSSIAFYQDERFWPNEAESIANCVPGQQNYAVPDDYLRMDFLTYTAEDIRYPISQVSWRMLRQKQQYQLTQSRPDYFAFYRNQLWLWPIPDQNYVLTISYLKRVPELSAVADLDAWTQEAEELIRCHTISRLLTHPSIASSVAPNVLAIWDARTRDALDELRIRSAGKIQDRELNMDDTLVRKSRRRYNIFWN